MDTTKTRFKVEHKKILHYTDIQVTLPRSVYLSPLECWNEKSVQDLFLYVMNLNPYQFMRNNVGMATYIDSHGEQTPVKYGLDKGSADLIGVAEGRFVAVEVKRDKKNKQSHSQEIWQKKIENCGGEYCLLHRENFWDVVEIIMRKEILMGDYG